jgi:hypothetical protein
MTELGQVAMKEMLDRFCEAGALSVARYAEVSGLLPEHDLPESFMPAFILNQLGDSLSMTIETSLSKLLLWNTQIHRRRGYSLALGPHRAASLGVPLVDMVIFSGRDPMNRDILALVEFKSGWIDTTEIPGRRNDRDKIRSILEYVDTCRYGVTCGWTRHLDYYKNQADEAGEPFWKHQIALANGRTDYYFCARLFERAKPNYPAAP